MGYTAGLCVYFLWGLVMPERLAQLSDWVRQCLSGESIRLEVASGDASFRRYFRVFAKNGTLIAVDAPPSQEDSRLFIHVSRAFHAQGVQVPEVVEHDLDQGFMLLTDLGSRLYLDELDQSSADRLYADAFAALKKIQAIDLRQATLPAYDSQLLYQELQLFMDWYLGNHLCLELDDEEKQGMEGICDFLVHSALEQPQVCVHRDYHSRNLMLTKKNNPGVLDFQDAVIGPVTYDAVSLLRDCYIDWPQERVEQWADCCFENACDLGLLGVGDRGSYHRWFDLMGAQRQMKAIGIFSRLNYRDRKPGYLSDIPRTLGYLISVSENYNEMVFLRDFIRDRVIPQIEKRKPEIVAR